MLKFKKLRHKDVKTSDFGKEVTIRVNQESIKHYSKKVALHNKIAEMDLSDEDKVAYNMAASLISVCTLGKDDDYAFQESQLSDFVENVSFDLFAELSAANREVNPFDEAEMKAIQKTMKAKKKST